MADTTSKQGDITEGAKRKADVKQRRQPDNISNHRVGKCSVVFRSANDIELRVRIHSPEIIQLQYTLDSDLKSDFSYAIDPNFEPASPSFEVNEKDRHFDISTASVICRVSKKKMKIQFLDNEGNVLDQDAKGYERYDSLMKGTTKIRITKKAPDHTAYFGLGDKASNQNLRGQSCQNWNTDCYAYERDDDPLYRSIPFYAALYENRAYGIFVDNSYRSHFDFDSKGKNISSFAVDGGIMNYYFIYGPDLTTVTERYTKLTGTPELPPLWALGYHQCRWSYFPESRVMEIARSFRDKEIPCDAIYLDIDYLDEFRSFTWDSDRFPDPKKMIKKLKNQGFKTVVMIDPGIKVDPQYFVYKQGLENDFFCKRADGDLMTGPVWPSQCAFPDFTNPDVRDWWANLYEDLMSNKKVAGIWNDMNEPAMFEVKHKTLPDDVRHDYDGHRCSHKKAHNIYGMQMVRASQKGIKKYNEGNRPFLLTRANFSGGQRYAALWTGDNISNWDHLKLANQQCQRLSISGYSFVGTDIGGFVKQPSAQLFTRWLQLSVFHPLFRNHTMGYNTDGASAVDEEYVEQKKKKTTANQEPWTFGKKYTDINRSVIELRYRLLHYLYTAFWKYTREGTPILRPLRYFDQADKTIANHDDQFLFGEKILVSPVVKKNKQSVKTYFPKGRWYDYRTNECYEGQSTHEIDAPIADIPFFIKEGTVLPLREVMQHSRERDPDFMELNIYYGEQESESLLYEDAEEGYEYQKGAYRLTTFRMKPSPDKKKIIIKKSQQGDWSPAYAKIKINVIGLPFECSSVSLDGKDVAFNTEKNDLSPVVSLQAKDRFSRLEING